MNTIKKFIIIISTLCLKAFECLMFFLLEINDYSIFLTQRVITILTSYSYFSVMAKGTTKKVFVEIRSKSLIMLIISDYIMTAMKLQYVKSPNIRMYRIIIFRVYRTDVKNLFWNFQ